MKANFVAVLVASVFCVIARAECPPGDLNRDSRVDAADLVLFTAEWLTGSGGAANLAGDPNVDATDLAVLASHWQQVNCPIVINEVLAHAHAEASDWIELYNPGTVRVDIGGWFLSDTDTDLEKYQIAEGTVVEPNGYVVLYETTTFGNPFDPGVRTLFAFTENGEGAYLYSGNDEVFPDYLTSESFGASETSYSFGRYRKSTGAYDFPTMSVVTPGAANAYPRVGPVVINEIMYHPKGDADAEYIELLNVTDATVTLFDYECGEPWRVMDDSGIDFKFPTKAPVTLAPRECVLLVKDPTAMQQYTVPAGAKVFAWPSGKLANQGERLQLFKPGDVDEQGVRYWIEVDRVNFSDGSHGKDFRNGVDPWPAGADGQGLSLSRLFSRRYGNDPNNWQAAIPTPGAAND
ncbi:MAG: lamin tail domain-containing protein [Solirubrobacterales bacterium]